MPKDFERFPKDFERFRKILKDFRWFWKEFLSLKLVQPDSGHKWSGSWGFEEKTARFLGFWKAFATNQPFLLRGRSRVRSE